MDREHWGRAFWKLEDLQTPLALAVSCPRLEGVNEKRRQTANDSLVADEARERTEAISKPIEIPHVVVAAKSIEREDTQQTLRMPALSSTEDSQGSAEMPHCLGTDSVQDLR